MGFSGALGKSLFSPEARAEEGSAIFRRFAFAAALLRPVAVAVHFQDMHVVGEPI